MAEMTREQFIAMQNQFNQRQNSQNENTTHIQPWFRIKDGEEAIVRFAYKSADDLKYMTVHKVKDGDSVYPRNVNCLRDFRDKIDTCPLCAVGDRPKQRMFIQLIAYTADEDGKIVPQPCIWEMAAQTWMTKLINYFQEYPDLVEQIFKIKRTGSGLDTTYTEMPANPKVYKNEDYPYDLSVFDDYTPLGTYALQDIAKEDMYKYVALLEPKEETVDITENLPKRTVHTF